MFSFSRAAEARCRPPSCLNICLCYHTSRTLVYLTLCLVKIPRSGLVCFTGAVRYFEGRFMPSLFSCRPLGKSRFWPDVSRPGGWGGGGRRRLFLVSPRTAVSLLSILFFCCPLPFFFFCPNADASVVVCGGQVPCILRPGDHHIMPFVIFDPLTYPRLNLPYAPRWGILFFLLSTLAVVKKLSITHR